jgi:hypothetical protein
LHPLACLRHQLHDHPAQRLMQRSEHHQPLHAPSLLHG